MIEELKIQKQNSLQHTKVRFNPKTAGWGQFDHLWCFENCIF